MRPALIDTTELEKEFVCTNCHKDYCDCLRRGERLDKYRRYNASVEQAVKCGAIDLIDETVNYWIVDNKYYWYPKARKWRRIGCGKFYRARDFEDFWRMIQRNAGQTGDGGAKHAHRPPQGAMYPVLISLDRLYGLAHTQALRHNESVAQAEAAGVLRSIVVYRQDRWQVNVGKTYCYFNPINGMWRRAKSDEGFVNQADDFSALLEALKQIENQRISVA